MTAPIQQQQTKAQYQARIARVIDYIYDHLRDDLDMDKLAEIACLSSWHWHRIYRGMTGETARMTITRIRLHYAAKSLSDETVSMQDIAHQAGYASVEAFNRSFKREYGMPPGEYRRSRTQPLPIQHPMIGDTTMTKTYDVTLLEQEAMRLAYLEHRGSYMDIGRRFEQLFVWASTRGLMTPQTRSFGIYYDDPSEKPEEDLRSEAAMIVDDTVTADDTIKVKTIPAMRVARIIHKGPYAELTKAYNWLYASWLPESGEEPSNNPCFEEYLNDPRTTSPADLLTAINMPLR